MTWVTDDGKRIAAIVPVDAGEEYEKRFSAPDANVVADPYSDKPRPVGRNTVVRFGDAEFGSKYGAFDVRLTEDGELEVSIYDALGSKAAILPRADNSVRIRRVQQ
jgi:hypothetical protein